VERLSTHSKYLGTRKVHFTISSTFEKGFRVYSMGRDPSWCIGGSKEAWSKVGMCGGCGRGLLLSISGSLRLRLGVLLEEATLRGVGVGQGQ